jgi:hypothetical protein
MSDEPQAPGNNEAPQEQASGDPAAVAFEALREEVALVRRAMAGLAAERAARPIPDHSETLGNILQACIVAARRLKTLAELPALRLTPDSMGREIAAAGETARRADHVALTQASTALREIAHELKGQAQSARTAKEQRIWLIAIGTAGLVAGMVLWAVVTGFLARTPPISHQSPEQKASEMLGMDQEAAGEHLIQTAAPGLWRDLVLGDRIVIANRHTLELCQRKASRQPERCAIEISAGQP